ncbi:MAG: riboflavin synthase [Sporichthyaceae bacterium]|nr:riboflavin synthase [Sporichthyaceae bacterium]
MFTGIVEELGTVVALERLPDGAVLRVRGPLVTTDTKPGDSIAVNGVCLTVVERGDGEFSADVMAESLSRSTLGRLATGDPVNLERPVAAHAVDGAGGRLGGHIVQGHVDGVGTLISRTRSEHWDLLVIELPAELARYVATKGSIAVDGTSLTVVEVGPHWFSVALIPTTLEQTTLGRKEPGDPVNLEVDVIAKYVERLLEVRG